MATDKNAQTALSFAGITFTVQKTEATAITLDKAGDRSGLPPLMFDKLFDMIEDSALKGENPSFFVPVSLYQARHDHHFDNVVKQPSKKKALTAADVKGKLRDEFKKWVLSTAPLKDGKPVVAEAPRGVLELGFATRTGKEGIEGISEPGVTVWVMQAKKA